MVTYRSARGRRKSKSSFGGVIGLVLGLGVIVLLTWVAKSTLESRADAVTKPKQEEPGESAPARGLDENATVDPAPDRPAPELKGTLIIRADALFRDAKSLHAEALRAREKGETLAYQQGIADCRHKLDELDRLLGDFTSWLVEAKQKDWPVPRTYNTLERRQERYGRLRARLPPK